MTIQDKILKEEEYKQMVAMHMLKLTGAIPNANVTRDKTLQKYIIYFKNMDINKYNKIRIRQVIENFKLTTINVEDIEEYPMHAIGEEPIYSPILNINQMPIIFKNERFKLPIAVDIIPPEQLEIQKEELKRIIFETHTKPQFLFGNIDIVKEKELIKHQSKKESEKEKIMGIMKKTIYATLTKEEMEELKTSMTNKEIPKHLGEYCNNTKELELMIRYNKDIVYYFIAEDDVTHDDYKEAIVNMPLTLQLLELVNNMIKENKMQEEQIHIFLENAAKGCKDPKNLTHKRLARCLLMMLSSLIRKDKINYHTYAYQIRPLCTKYRALDIARKVLKQLTNE
mmetsp:Transcript_13815/g.20927  ORF Transcript_13815/g.20927 Transcript_13815/m.20927 type:complete len:340 (+) Transcript_13815:174-1193(+)